MNKYDGKCRGSNVDEKNYEKGEFWQTDRGGCCPKGNKTTEQELFGIPL